MRCSLKLLVPVIILAAPAVALAQSQPRFNVGTPLSQEEIKSFDSMIGGIAPPTARGQKYAS